MEATLKVIVGISGPLEKLALEALRLWRGPGQTQKPMPAPMPQAPPALPEPDPAPVEVTPAPVEEPEPTAMPLAEPEPEPEPATPEAVLMPAPDDETLRTLLDIVITRWAGQGSENSKDPKILRIRKDVCTAFKEIARHFGAEKPTKLQGEARNKFIHEIENNLYNSNGRIEWKAF